MRRFKVILLMLMLVSVLRMEAGVVINVPARPTITFPADNSESFTYDLNANLLTISRKGKDDAGSYRVVDEIEMGYIGNQLSWLRDTAEDPLLEGSMDIPQGNYSGYDIMYDGAGRITRDVSRGISHVNYNVTGTPFVVGTMTADCAVYGYTSSGAKLSETIYNGSVTTRRDYVGPCEYVDGKLERINVPQGYIDSLGVMHAYIHDIQGNIAGVYEAKAGKKQLEQLNEYYAYGGLTADSKGQDRNRYKHTGKELVSDLGINSYDFTARWQYPMAGAFTSPDELAYRKPWNSPYAFCGGDPINYTDPTGLWQIKINTKGEVVEAIDEGDVDVIDIVDNDGSTMVNANGEVLSLTFEKGTIENVTKIPTKEGSYDIIRVRGDGHASDLFTFLSNNICPVSHVEFSLVKTGISGNKGLNFVNSGHEEGSEPALSFLIDYQLRYDYTLREVIHSHPLGTSTKGSDERLADIVLHDRPNCKFYIYHVPTKKMIRFYGDGFSAKQLMRTRSKINILNK